jgi:hypothetical protein
VAVAAFAQKLKNEAPVADYSWDEIEGLAAEGRGDDRYGYRSEFLRMIEVVKGLEAGRDPEEQDNVSDFPRPLPSRDPAHPEILLPEE